jgi:hypothetical protein
MPAGAGEINRGRARRPAVARDCGRLRASLAYARDLQSRCPGNGQAPAKKIAGCRKKFKKRVDTEKGVGLYTAHRDGDAAGDVLSTALHWNAGPSEPTTSAQWLVSVTPRCLKTEDRKRNVDGEVLADLPTGKSNETSVCCVYKSHR